MLAELALVPYGRTTTYGSLASQRVGRPKAARAVGTVMNRNPLPIVLPCHRVVGATGALTGYAGGLDRKRLLLPRSKAPSSTSVSRRLPPRAAAGRNLRRVEAGGPRQARRTRVRTLAALGIAALVLPAAVAHATATTGPASAASKTCRRISLKTDARNRAYSIRIDQGTVTCASAKRVRLRRFLTKSVPPRGWLCFRGHASQHQSWAAACATPNGASVKAFLLKT